jgi:hypothetical protein
MPKRPSWRAREGRFAGGSAVEGGKRKGRLSNVGSNAGVAGMGGRELPEISRHPAVVHADMNTSEPVLLCRSNAVFWIICQFDKPNGPARSLGPPSIPYLGDGVMLGTAWIDRPVDTQGCAPCFHVLLSAAWKRGHAQANDRHSSRVFAMPPRGIARTTRNS